MSLAEFFKPLSQVGIRIPFLRRPPRHSSSKPEFFGEVRHHHAQLRKTKLTFIYVGAIRRVIILTDALDVVLCLIELKRYGENGVHQVWIDGLPLDI
ncbi:hypothetical protein A6R71_09840 [Xanthomonas translucens pv. arrhenatheri]|nr:hypothetical protein A6R71_09840 [Xanthomonas translucens pv. arrhenatheri]